MINLGCRNQFSVGIAFQVYMDLCEGAWYLGTVHAVQVLFDKTCEQPLNMGGSFIIIYACLSHNLAHLPPMIGTVTSVMIAKVK
jgi:hypothetical protein